MRTLLFARSPAASSTAASNSAASNSAASNSAASSTAARVGFAFVAAIVVSCSAEAPNVELERRSFDIIGGVPAAEAAFDHTGALVYRVRSSGDTGLLCSASVIGPQTLVTARHCTEPLPIFERIGVDVSFVPGADFNAASESVGIAAFAGSPVSEGGVFGYGNDVAVLHLERPLDIAPLRVLPFEPALVGEPLVTVGYGISSADGIVDGLRRVGEETIVSVEGRVFETWFDDFETFVEWRVTGTFSEADWLAVLELDPSLGDLEAFSAEWESWQLLTEYEVATRARAGSTQSCTGDSGGPIGRFAADGVFESFGVVSGGPGSIDSVCDYGQVFAIFGPESHPFVSAAAAWTDPCGDVDALGVCAGDVALRCRTSFTEGVRELVSEDCAASELSCAETDGGAVCALLEEPEPEPELKPHSPGARRWPKTGSPAR